MLKFDGFLAIIIKIVMTIDDFIQDVSMFILRKSIQIRNRKFKRKIK